MTQVDELKSLVQRRGQVKAQLTRFRSYVNTFDFRTERIECLEARLDKADKLFEKFEEIHCQIAKIDESTDHSIEHVAFENAYFDVMGLARQIIAQHKRNNNGGTAQNESSQNTSSSAANIKLPTINLPTFSGQYENWLQFHDMFNSLIHKNASLSPTQKFHYLRSSLKNDALQVISALEATDSNYDIAWTLLKERFENARLIVNNHVKALFDLPAVAKDSHVAIRQLLDSILKNLRALKTLKQPTEHWDTLIVHLITTKLDYPSRRDWESSIKENKIPTLDEMTKFLTNRAQILENLNPSSSSKQSNSKPYSQGKQQSHKLESKSYVATNNYKCAICNDDHALFKCAQFLKMSVSQRRNEVKIHKLCFNCLRPGHFTSECKSSSCKTCNGKHNSLLHLEESKSKANSNSTTNSEPGSEPNETLNTHCSQKQKSHILLSTALVHIVDQFGQFHECRALLDSGSQSNFITQELCTRLNLNCEKIDMPVVGINQVKTNITRKTTIEVKSRVTVFSELITCLVLPRITDKLPSVFISPSQVKIPDNMVLADPLFNKPGKIDLLLGASIFWNLLCEDPAINSKNQPTFKKTKLGWIMGGSLNSICQVRPQYKTTCNFSLEKQLEKFWEIEELDRYTGKKQLNYSQKEQQCEQHFVDTVTHSDDGHYIVSLPLCNNVSNLGESRTEALKRLVTMENKFNKRPELKLEYSKFMHEYEQMGHMTQVENEQQSKLSYYMPHHAVIKEASETTKLRVVFDGSSKTSTGLSLNETMLIGPTIQDDLLSIIIRFRTHKYVLTGDIAKMYRQVYIQENQRELQRILWRNSTSEEVKCYNLTTVTYGTAAAPFLAVRCLVEVANEHQEQYPKASDVIRKDFYVDDLLTGANTREEIVKLAEELRTILKRRGFDLRKWGSNESSIVQEIASTASDMDTQHLFISKDKERKTLGLLWNSQSDTFQYDVKINTNTKHVTKRTILSTICQIFDPLGLVGPTTIKVKIFLQALWQSKINWDDPIPNHLHTIWKQYHDQLHFLNKVIIPRHVICTSPIQIQLHGFADASETAYGACVYLRSINQEGNIKVQLFTAKARVAPLKTVTIPRLELCAALLLAQLVQKVKEAVRINFDETFFWSDSTITLAWISHSPNQWKTFISNRVAEIQRLTSGGQWRHVTSSDNPADIISRGTTADQIIVNELWWNGPKWLKTNEWPAYNLPKEDITLERKHTVTMVAVIDELPILTKFSKFSKLQRIIAYCVRFWNKKYKKISKEIGSLKLNELEDSTRRIIVMLQDQCFKQEKQDLKTKGRVNSKSKLANLNPFLDEQEIIRVGGRLKNSNLTSDHKNPYVLPEKHHVTDLIVRQEHIKLLHCGHEQLLASLRHKYWIISGRQVVKRITRNCLQCFKTKPRKLEHMMGNLPSVRVIGTHRPFITTGVDYAGPLQLRESLRRGRPTMSKGYICVFVCFNTKAVHLELVTNLTTECFLAALRRFTARRGLCSKLYSDNATNFTCANSQLKQFYEFLQRNNDSLTSNLASQMIEWHFIPPRAPHFGGLWEAAVKSVKTHLARVTQGLILTFEQCTTLLTEIESILNSRPICPISSSPNDLTPLTPAHFLIGDSLLQPVEMPYLNTPENHLSQWQHMQRVKQHFWQRWHREYLHQLQVRCKWHQPHPNVNIGDLVLLIEDNLPPLKWITRRIITTHPGEDNIVRVVTVKTASGGFKRPVKKLCALPSERE